jgi:hypothetical protein
MGIDSISGGLFATDLLSNIFPGLLIQIHLVGDRIYHEFVVVYAQDFEIAIFIADGVKDRDGPRLDIPGDLDVEIEIIRLKNVQKLVKATTSEDVRTFLALQDVNDILVPHVGQLPLVGLTRLLHVYDKLLVAIHDEGSDSIFKYLEFYRQIGLDISKEIYGVAFIFPNFFIIHFFNIEYLNFLCGLHSTGHVASI